MNICTHACVDPCIFIHVPYVHTCICIYKHIYTYVYMALCGNPCVKQVSFLPLRRHPCDGLLDANNYGSFPEASKAAQFGLWSCKT